MHYCNHKKFDVTIMHSRSHESVTPEFVASISNRSALSVVLWTFYTGVLFFIAIVGSVCNVVKNILFPGRTKNITGQCAFVTGGANGLGREICLRLAKEGCNVAVTDIDVENAEKTALDVKLLGVNAKAYKLDITDFEAVENVKKCVVNDLGPVDILVNNAGTFEDVTFDDHNFEDFRRVIEINLLSVICVSINQLNITCSHIWHFDILVLNSYTINESLVEI